MKSVKVVRKETYRKMRDIFERQKHINGFDNAVGFFEIMEDVIEQILMEAENGDNEDTEIHEHS